MPSLSQKSCIFALEIVNNNIKTYDLDSVFSEFTNSFSGTHQNKRAKLEEEIALLKQTIEADEKEYKTLSCTIG